MIDVEGKWTFEFGSNFDGVEGIVVIELGDGL